MLYLIYQFFNLWLLNLYHNDNHNSLGLSIDGNDTSKLILFELICTEKTKGFIKKLKRFFTWFFLQKTLWENLMLLNKKVQSIF